MWHDALNPYLWSLKNQFIAVINNENPLKFNSTYKDNLSKLENFVMVQFDEDSVVQPIESQHFGFYYPGQASEVQGWLKRLDLGCVKSPQMQETARTWNHLT